ncbi:MAG: phage antirepressor KilAC domain-containing protein [Salinisphaeraceae bacterium]
MANGRYTLDEAAALLDKGRNTLARELRAAGVLDPNNLPGPRYRGRGYMVVRRNSYLHPRKGRVEYGRVLFTTAGLRLIAERLHMQPAENPTQH